MFVLMVRIVVDQRILPFMECLPKTFLEEGVPSIFKYLFSDHQLFDGKFGATRYREIP